MPGPTWAGHPRLGVGVVDGRGQPGHDVHCNHTPAYIRPGLSTPAGSNAALMSLVIRISGPGKGSNTSTAARTSAGARTRVALPPCRLTAARTAAAAASPLASVATQTSPPLQS